MTGHSHRDLKDERVEILDSMGYELQYYADRDVFGPLFHHSVCEFQPPRAGNDLMNLSS